MLLKKLRVDPNLADSLYGTTPLHHAAAGGQIKMIEALIENYLCDIEAPDKGGSTPLCFAIAYDQNASLRKLLDHGASVEVESFLGLPIFMAIYRGNTEAVRMLYMKNPNVLNFEMYDFCTPLVAAASCSSTACFKYLVEVGDVNARPLMYKVISCADSEEKALERIEILLNRGVDPNASYDAVTLFEERPIFCAAKRRWKNLVETLLQSTNRVPGIEWTTEGVIQYVNSEAFGTFHKVTRVLHLKDRLLQEIRANHCLAADLICKVLHVDMDMEEWDLYQSLCEIF
ncbi:unnamed protein product [Urochloa decumbens]|uniref:Ankyrin repeat protein n=1 Tax=Urochloa decumbens TaxID=240449 RepID=A0ABC9A7V8_9POAL